MYLHHFKPDINQEPYILCPRSSDSTAPNPICNPSRPASGTPKLTSITPIYLYLMRSCARRFSLSSFLSRAKYHSHIHFYIYSLFRPMPLPNTLLLLHLFTLQATCGLADTLYQCQCHYHTINCFVLLVSKHTRRPTPSLPSLPLLRASPTSIRSSHLLCFIHLQVGMFILLRLGLSTFCTLADDRLAMCYPKMAVLYNGNGRD